MKKLLILSALASSLFLGACGNADEVTSEVGDVVENNDITAAEVPARVMAAFNASYPDATEVTWERETHNGRNEYEATFKQGTERRTAEYDEAGNVINVNN